MRMRRRPLMRAAMVGGTAYVAGKHVANKSQQEAEQEQRIADLEAQQSQQAVAAAPPPPPPPPPPAAAAPPAAPAGGGDLASQLMELKGLMDQGILSPEEFEAAKAKLLAG
jgi:Short C-terminal domain